MKTLEQTKQYLTLDYAYQFYNNRLFSGELPGCLLTFQRKKSSEGYYNPEGFVSKAADSKTDEIAMNPDFFYSDEKRVLSTLVHEMCHLWQKHFGTYQGSYHDKQWANKMESVGLMPSDTGQPGGKRTGQKVGDYIIKGGLFDTVTNELLKDKIIQWYSQSFEFVKSRIKSIMGNAIKLSNAKDIKPGSMLEINNMRYEIESVEGDEVRIKNGGAEINLGKGDEVVVHQRREKKYDKNKVKYTCPKCGANVWGRPGLRIMCIDCEEMYFEK